MADRLYNLQRDVEDSRDYLYQAAGLKAALPKSIDLRSKCPSVYNQGSEGSCTAHAGCACRSMLAKNKKLDLSRAFLYYQTRLLEDKTQEDSGASIRDTCKSVQKFGICKASFMPYVAGNYRTAPSAAALRNALKYKIGVYRKVSDSSDIKQALFSRKQPAMVGMTVFESMESQKVAKSGILPMPQKNEKELGGHAVLIVGYSDAKKMSGLKKFFSRFFCRKTSAGYFIVRNSWGAGWGIRGYFKMPYEYFEKYCFDFWIME